MNATRSLHLKTCAMLALMVVFGAAGDVLLSKGVKEIGSLDAWSPAALGAFLWSVFTHPTVWLGILGLAAYFVCYTLVLSWADFSFVLPASALTYVLVPLLALVFLGERVSPLRWAGVGLIFLGVAAVGLTPPSTAPVARPEPEQGD
jgi:drug/metabolite transporter (DMT)-like permease